MLLASAARELYRTDAARWSALEAWYQDPANNAAAAHLHQLDKLFARWHEVDAGELLTDEPDLEETDKLLDTAEDYAAEYGYVLPPGHRVWKEDILGRTPLGHEAEAVAQEADKLIHDAETVTKPIAAIPWYVWAGGAALALGAVATVAIAAEPAGALLLARAFRGPSPPPPFDPWRARYA